MPVNAEVFKCLLQEANYPQKKINFLYSGFTKGFSLGYQGDETVQLYSPNLRLSVGSPCILWNKVIKEVRAGRIAGPFKEVPFKYFIQSPIGLVLKDGGLETHLIFHLSYPKGGSTSVNANIPKEDCSVSYSDFDEAIRICLACMTQAKQPIFIGKSDILSAFRNLGLENGSWRWTVLKATCPINNITYYFVDKCLPFGSSISCALFQEVANAIAFLVKFRTKHPLCNYLDDYLFVAVLQSFCNWQIQRFLDICHEISMPVSMKKTFWASIQLTFLGFLIDRTRFLVLIPLEKLKKAVDLINEFLEKGKRKTTLFRLQQLCGFLNFLNRCIIPGRAFTRRLYANIKPSLQPHHHLPVTGEMKADLRVWQQFINHPSAFCRSFADFSNAIPIQITDFHTDASRKFLLGGGGVCRNQWFFVPWDPLFMVKAQPSIEYLELYALAIGFMLWADRFANSRIFVFCDNTAVISMVNTSSSRCRNCMVLIRLIVLQSLKHNVLLRVKYISSKSNDRADAISRRKFDLFHKLSNYNADSQHCELPSVLHPMAKIWCY